MIGLLRFIGIVNAAIWLGAAVFFTFFSGPGFFTKEMKELLPPPYNGAAAALIIKRYFILQHACGLLALIHLVAEWLYLGHRVPRVIFAILLAVFCLNLTGGFWLQPKMNDLHLAKYRGTTQEARDQAAKSFGMWHGISQAGNIVILPFLFVYLWRVSNSNRTISFGKASAGWR